MNKPINETTFWKDRIDNDAKDDIRRSVYQTSDDDWIKIDENHFEIIKENVTGKVLDAGCGYGRLASLFDPADYIGVDFSPDFIKLAKERNPDYRFVQASLDALPFADGQFDWAICVSIKRMVIQNINELFWEEMLSELKRVAKHVLVLEYEDPDKPEIL